jgi:hypothetical protein
MVLVAWNNTFCVPEQRMSSEPSSRDLTLATATTSRAHEPTANERAALAADRARITEIEAQMAELHHSLDLLQQEKDSLQDRLDAYTYPVMTLPNEITSEIFVRFIPAYPKCPPLRGPHSPLLLGQICRKWREIAVSTPALWRAVALFFRLEAPHEQKLRVLETFFNRSGAQPLSITLYSGQVGRSRIVPALTETLHSYSLRCQHLKLTTYLDALRSIDGSFPLLRSLTIDVFFEGLAESDSAVTLAFNQAPLLQNVSIGSYDGFYFDILPWRQLTVLVVRGILVVESARILKETVNLVHCKFMTFNPRREAERPRQAHLSI